MKKRLYLLLLCAGLFTFTTTMTSCSKKTGCPMNEPGKVGAKADKKGKLSTKRGSSSLFPKNMRKKKKK